MQSLGNSHLKQTPCSFFHLRLISVLPADRGAKEIQREKRVSSPQGCPALLPSTPRKSGEKTEKRTFGDFRALEEASERAETTLEMATWWQDGPTAFSGTHRRGPGRDIKERI